MWTTCQRAREAMMRGFLIELSSPIVDDCPMIRVCAGEEE